MFTYENYLKDLINNKENLKTAINENLIITEVQFLYKMQECMQSVIENDNYIKLSLEFDEDACNQIDNVYLVFGNAKIKLSLLRDLKNYNDVSNNVVCIDEKEFQADKKILLDLLKDKKMQEYINILLSVNITYEQIYYIDFINNNNIDISKILNTTKKINFLSDIDKINLFNDREKYLTYSNIEYMIKDAENILFKCSENLLNYILKCYDTNDFIFDDFTVVYNNEECEFTTDNSIINALQSNAVNIELQYSYILLECNEKTEKQLKNLVDLNIDKYASILSILL